MKKYTFLLALIFSLAACQNGKELDHRLTSGPQAELEAIAGDYILFDSSSAILNSEARDTLDKQIAWLKENSELRATIEGHCDIRGTREYNLALGARRASTVRQYMTSGGVHSSRISTISYGKENNPVLGDGEQVWRQNRRAITVVIE